MATQLLLFTLFLAGLGLAAASWLAGPALLSHWRRSRIRAQPFPLPWRRILRQDMPAFARMPANLQLQLKKHIQVLLAETPFIGCNGLVVTDRMRVLIAAQAGLLLLNRRSAQFDNLRQVLVYPGPFIVERPQGDAMGLMHETRRTLAGESWQQGQLLLSWDDVLAGAANPEDGRNVVIHEFAHQLDQAKGVANGAPWLGTNRRQARWAQVMGSEYAALRARLARGETGLIDPYGATDPAEFFAVVSEHFFEQPAALAAAHASLYAEFSRYYRIDPLSW